MRVAANGFDKTVLLTRGAKPCAPAIFIDGSPMIGRSGDLDFLALPDEVSGIEIYKGPASTPPQFYLPSTATCGSIVIWTRSRFRVPKKPVDSKP